MQTVAILGRPNVGKSSIFNRLAGRRIAIVDDTPGVTRDRKEVEAEIGGIPVTLIDTAGLEEAAPETLAGRMTASSDAALRQADLVLFVIDCRTGLTAADRAFANWLRRADVPVLLLANKAEGRLGIQNAMEAYELGLGDPIPVSAEHGDGFGTLHDEVRDHLQKEPRGNRGDRERPLRLAIVGRPNAGKSTLLNTLLGEERMITGPEPGLTRDAIAVQIKDEVGPIRLVDTAGLRKQARIEKDLEKMSTGASIAALKEAEVVILVIDALLGMEEQDLRIARLAEREGRACVIAFNKWDAVEDRAACRKKLDDVLTFSLAQMKGIMVVPISAANGRGIDRLLPAVREVHDLWNRRIGTGELNRCSR